MNRPKVRRGTRALPTKVHEPKRRYRRSDEIDGVSFGDWYEQQLVEYGYEIEQHSYNPASPTPGVPKRPKS